jgi:beta-barrel assembly-enhancing protease
MPRITRNYLQLIAILLGLFIVNALAQDNVDPKKGRVTGNPMSGNRYTIEQEIQIGREGMADVEKKLPILPASHPMSKYISALGQQLAAKAPGYKFPYTFKVVREKSINAFALPGGPIYVHTGLIEAANESELAGVMGHEISHVVMRHSTRQASRAMKTQIPLAILGGVLGAGVGGWAGALGQMGISLTSGTVLMKYSRDAETEADMVGAQIMYDAGYNPQAMVTFFNKLKQQQQGKGGGPQFLASHPDPGNRAQNVSKILSRFPPKTFQQEDSSEFLAAKKALSEPGSVSTATEKSAEIPRLSLENIASPNYKTFRAAAYAISYPDNWEISGDANSSLTIYPKGGSANGALAYGVMISGFEPKNKTKELDNGLRELMTDIQMANPGLRIANSPQAFTVQGLPARKLDWFGTSAVRENGKPFTERVRLVAIQTKSGVVLYLVFVAPDDDFQGLWPVFEKMLNSLQLR